MNENQWRRMLDYAVLRLEALRQGMADWQTAMGRALRESEHDLQDRVNDRSAQIFIKSNESTDVVPAAAEFIHARTPSPSTATGLKPGLVHSTLCPSSE